MCIREARRSTSVVISPQLVIDVSVVTGDSGTGAGGEIQGKRIRTWDQDIEASVSVVGLREWLHWHSFPFTMLSIDAHSGYLHTSSAGGKVASGLRMSARRRSKDDQPSLLPLILQSYRLQWCPETLTRPSYQVHSSALMVHDPQPRGVCE